MSEALLCQTQLTAMDFLEQCVRNFEPLAALAGDAGTGKTTALDAALARRDRAGDRIIRARNFPAGPLSLHRALTAALGVADAGALSATQLEAALRRALAESGHRAPPVLAVDNAHSLPPETLRYLSLLAGLREGGRPLFRILLVGRSGFTAPLAVPVQLTLEPVHPEAARQVIEQRLAETGVTLEDEAVHGIVTGARGNLGRLDALLRANIEQARAKRGRRLRSLMSRLELAARRVLGDKHPRWRDTLAAAAALLAVSATGGFIAYRTGTPRGALESKSGSVPPGHAESTKPTPMAALLELTPPETPNRPAPPVSHLAAAAPSPPSVPPAPSPPAPMQGVPEDLPSPPIPPATESEVPAAVAALGVTPSSDTGRALQELLMPRPKPSRFRVNNVSSCHHGVCPRWSVTDVERKDHFFAAFDPTPLHLDRDTLQRLRQGALELTVSGSIRKRGTESQTLVAESVQSMAPHHGHPRPAAPEGGDPASSQDHSPAPGFLQGPVEQLPPGDNSNTGSTIDPDQ